MQNHKTRKIYKNSIFILLFLMFGVIFLMNGRSDKTINKQLKQKETKALEGDTKSSQNLSSYYGTELDDIENERFWICIWFENDNLSGAWNHAWVNYMGMKDSLRFLYLYFSCEEQMCNIDPNRESRNITIKIYKEDHEKYPDFYFADDNLKYKEINESTFQYFYDEACLGSGLAALKLAEYYENKTSENLYEKYPRLLELGYHYNPDEEKYPLFWYRIGSQNGNKECMKKYAELLLNSKDKYDNIRAEFWKKKSEEKE